MTTEGLTVTVREGDITVYNGIENRGYVFSVKAECERFFASELRKQARLMSLSSSIILQEEQYISQALRTK